MDKIYGHETNSYRFYRVWSSKLSPRLWKQFKNHMKRHKEEEKFSNKYDCVECGKGFNKFTETSVKKNKFDQYIWIHKNFTFQCDCQNISINTETAL